jgi:hypothetical protein
MWLRLRAVLITSIGLWGRAVLIVDALFVADGTESLEKLWLLSNRLEFKLMEICFHWRPEDIRIGMPECEGHLHDGYQQFRV